MKLPKLLPYFLGLALSFSITACDDGDDGSSDSNADTNNDNSDNATEEGGMDVDCPTFCTGFVDLCIQTGNSTEFETYDACVEACGAWDQAGINCRNEQVAGGACDQAGNMGSAC